MLLNRKNFIQWLSAPVLLPALAPTSIAKDQHFRLGSGHKVDSEDQDGKKTRQNFIAIYDSRTQSVKHIKTTHDVHSLIEHPKENLIIAFSKEQQTFSALLANDQLVELEALKGNIMSGHGIFSPDGKFFISSETNEAQTSGDLVVRDAKTMKVVRRMGSHGTYPHEMVFADGGRSLIVANGGHAFKGSNLSVLEFRTGKLKEQYSPKSEGPGCRHFVVDDQGNFVIGTWGRHSAYGESKHVKASVLWGKRSASAREVAKEIVAPADGAHQFLSVGLSSMQTLALTSGSGNSRVYIVEAKTGKVQKHLEIPNPAGIMKTSDPNIMVVTADGGSLYQIDLRQGKLLRDKPLVEKAMRGSHLTFLRA